MPGLGYIYAPDARDFRMRLAEPSTRVSRFWLNGPVLNQGETNSCVGFSLKQLIQTEPYLTYDVNAMAVYARALQIDEFPGEQDTGTSLRAGLKALQELGFVERYEWAYNAEQVKQWVLQNGPVVVGHVITTGFMNPNKTTGFVDIKGLPKGGHAYAIVGFSKTRDAFRFPNSWGTSWGVKGRGWIKYADLDYLLRNQGDAVGIIEKRNKNENTRINLRSNI